MCSRVISHNLPKVREFLSHTLSPLCTEFKMRIHPRNIFSSFSYLCIDIVRKIKIQNVSSFINYIIYMYICKQKNRIIEIYSEVITTKEKKSISDFNKVRLNDFGGRSLAS